MAASHSYTGPMERSVRRGMTAQRAQRAASAGLVCLLVLTACSGEPEPESQVFARPTAKEKVSDAVRAVRAISRRGGCSALATRWHSANGPLSDVACEDILDDLDGFGSVRPSRHGTGLAVSFAHSDGGRRSAVMALDLDGLWKLLLVSNVDRGPIPPPSDVDSRVTKAIEAITTVDCESILQLAHRGIGMASARSRRQACRDVASSYLARALAVYPQRNLRRLGGGRNFTFYALDLGGGGYFTVLMARDPLGSAEGKLVVQRLVSAVRAR